MATLGRRPSNAALTSADIPDDSITAAKIVAGAVSSDVVYLENNTSTQTLSGTYSTERLYFNDSYQLTGNVTVTGHLALGSIADEDIVITNDSSARTLTVDGGVIEAGGLLAEESKDLTGMTGELGSVVTGSPALNLGNATFPAGHVIKYEKVYLESTYSAVTSTTATTYWSPTFTPSGGSGDNTKIYAWLNLHFRNGSTISDGRLIHTYTVTGTDISDLAAYSPESGYSFGAYDTSSGHTQNYITTISLDPVTLDGTGHATITYNFIMQNENANAGSSWAIKGTSGRETNITFMEVQA